MNAWVFCGQGGSSVGGTELDLTPLGGSVLSVSSERVGFDIVATVRGLYRPLEHEAIVLKQVEVVLGSVVTGMRLRKAGVEPGALLGHSLGEYSALVVSEAITIPDCLGLVKSRALAASTSTSDGGGRMAAIVGVPLIKIERLCGDVGTVIAAYNGPEHFTISGPSSCISKALQFCRETKIKAIRLDIHGAFHSPWMTPAANALRDELRKIDVGPPSTALWSPTTAAVVETAQDVRDVLVAQLTGPVRWQETIARMVEHGDVRRFVDMGPGRTMIGLLRRLVGPATQVVAAKDVLLSQ